MSERPFKIAHGWEEHIMLADTIIFATGATAIKLDLPLVDKYIENG